MSANSFFPVVGPSVTAFAGGALALLGVGSVALVSLQLFGAGSERQPLTATIGTLSAGA